VWCLFNHNAVPLISGAAALETLLVFDSTTCRRLDRAVDLVFTTPRGAAHVPAVAPGGNPRAATPAATWALPTFAAGRFGAEAL
jgi:hypothetical protein